MPKFFAALAAVAIMMIGGLPATAGQLHNAVRDSDMAKLLQLIEAGEDLTAQDNIAGTALHWAALTGNAEAARLLIDAGVDLDLAKRSDQRTALHIAAERGSVGVVSLLVAAGANIEAGTSDGSTPLHVAVGTDHVGVGKLLIGAGANLDTFAMGGTPLMVAAEANAVEAIELLIAAGVNVDEKTESGETSLKLAATSGRADAVRKLLELGADVNGAPDVAPAFPTTPLASATNRGLEEIAAILRTAGATQ